MFTEFQKNILFMKCIKKKYTCSYLTLKLLLMLTIFRKRFDNFGQSFDADAIWF